MLHAVIMAGGSGTRFWPASRKSTPKQLLPLVGNKTMLRQTFERLAGLVPPDRVLVITNQALVQQVRHELPELPADCVVGEPCKRDTAPCIGLAAKLIAQRGDSDSTMLVMPADHVIETSAKFQSAVRAAADLVAEQETRIVTFGVEPSYPAESFGYIQRGVALETKHRDVEAFAVQTFREKPSLSVAQEYLASGDYFWNAGIFVWRAATIEQALAQHQPNMSQSLERITAAWATADQAATFDREFTAIEGISIDYAVMEHANDVAVIRAPFQWDDVGSWQSIARLSGSDSHGNSVAGRHLGLRTQGSIIQSSGDHLVVTLGLKDCVVVRTDDATLIANKHDEESIRELVKELEKRGWTDVL